MGKWKRAKSEDAPVKVFKVPEDLYSQLSEQSADYKLLLRNIVEGATKVRDAERAVVEMIYKVQDSNSSEEAKQFWMDRLEAIMIVMGLNSKARDQLMLMQEDYRKLYVGYSDMYDKVKELEEKLSKYENLED